MKKYFRKSSIATVLLIILFVADFQGCFQISDVQFDCRKINYVDIFTNKPNLYQYLYKLEEKDKICELCKDYLNNSTRNDAKFFVNYWIELHGDNFVDSIGINNESFTYKAKTYKTSKNSEEFIRSFSK